TAPVYVPAEIPVMLTATCTVPLLVPEDGETESQPWLSLTVQLSVPPPLLLTVKLCAPGLAPPAVPLKLSVELPSDRAGDAGGGVVVPPPVGGAAAVPPTWIAFRMPRRTMPVTSTCSTPFVTFAVNRFTSGAFEGASVRMSKLFSTVVPFRATLNTRCPLPEYRISAKYRV